MSKETRRPRQNMNMLFCKVVGLSCSEGIVALAEKLRINARSGKREFFRQKTIKNLLTVILLLYT